MFQQNNNNRKKSVKKGFTLIELIVALLLLSVVLTLLFSSFSQISRGTKMLNAQLGERQELRLLISIVTQDIEAAQYYSNFAATGKASGIKATMDFVGDKKFTKIHFHSSVHSRFFRRVEAEADPEMHEVSYWIEQDEDDRSIYKLMRREDYFLDDDITSGGVSAELARGLEEFTVEFLEKAVIPSGQEVTWLEEWDSKIKKKDPLPMSVRVTLGQSGESGKSLKEVMEINFPSTMNLKK